MAKVLPEVTTTALEGNLALMRRADFQAVFFDRGVVLTWNRRNSCIDAVRATQDSNGRWSFERRTGDEADWFSLIVSADAPEEEAAADQKLAAVVESDKHETAARASRPSSGSDQSMRHGASMSSA